MLVVEDGKFQPVSQRPPRDECPAIFQILWSRHTVLPHFIKQRHNFHGEEDRICVYVKHKNMLQQCSRDALPSPPDAGGCQSMLEHLSDTLTSTTYCQLGARLTLIHDALAYAARDRTVMMLSLEVDESRKTGSKRGPSSGGPDTVTTASRRAPPARDSRPADGHTWGLTGAQMEARWVCLFIVDCPITSFMNHSGERYPSLKSATVSDDRQTRGPCVHHGKSGTSALVSIHTHSGTTGITPSTPVAHEMRNA